MNTQQAKRIPLQDILSRLGHEPAKQVRGEFWYCSPFRPETVPSFKINPERNVWYDFGEGVGGNVLDFVMKYHKVSSIAAALEELAAFDQPRLPALSTPRSTPAPQPIQRVAALPESTVKPLQHKALTNYLAARGIPLDIARRYLDEIHYTRDSKAYFALAFRNASDGYEIRNPYFKGSHGPKDITILPGLTTPPIKWAVFEGFMDFLSALAAGVLQSPMPTVLVLNSNALKEKALEAFQRHGAGAIDLYLDHDQSGRELTSWLEQALVGAEVTDRSGLYTGHKDVNDYLTAGRQRAACR